MPELSAFERLLQHPDAFSHILRDVLTLLDPRSLRRLRCCSRATRQIVDRLVWGNSVGLKRMRGRLMKSWLQEGDCREAAFQCADDVFDMKFRGNSLICGLRNGTVEVWNVETLQKELSLLDQEGSVQVDGNDDVIVGASSDSTVCIWDRRAGKLQQTFYHHRASVWGLQIQGDLAITGSMDRTVAMLDWRKRSLVTQFVAHDNEWGVSDLDTAQDVLVTGCFGGQIKVWSLAESKSTRAGDALPLLMVIDAGHAINCVSVCKELGLVASCSRTGRRDGGLANVIIWSLDTGQPVRKMHDMNSSCFVQLDVDKLLVLSSGSRDTVMGEPHVVKYPIGVINVVAGINFNDDNRLRRSQVLLRYRRSPAVAADRTKLAYSQDRTPGMCTIVEFWPC